MFIEALILESRHAQNPYFWSLRYNFFVILLFFQLSKFSQFFEFFHFFCFWLISFHIPQKVTEPILFWASTLIQNNFSLQNPQRSVLCNFGSFLQWSSNNKVLTIGTKGDFNVFCSTDFQSMSANHGWFFISSIPLLPSLLFGFLIKSWIIFIVLC